MLGVQVHDKDGHCYPLESEEVYDLRSHPNLRFSKELQDRQVITVEPGIYFIKSLLESMRCEPFKSHINWPLVDELKPYGGIRIEDNIAIIDDRVENITRDSFSTISALIHCGDERHLLDRNKSKYYPPPPDENSENFVRGYN